MCVCARAPTYTPSLWANKAFAIPTSALGVCFCVLRVFNVEYLRCGRFDLISKTTRTERERESEKIGPKNYLFFCSTSKLGSAVAKFVVEHVLHDTFDCKCLIHSTMRYIETILTKRTTTLLDNSRTHWSDFSRTRTRLLSNNTQQIDWN